MRSNYPKRNLYTKYIHYLAWAPPKPYKNQEAFLAGKDKESWSSARLAVKPSAALFIIVSPLFELANERTSIEEYTTNH